MATKKGPQSPFILGEGVTIFNSWPEESPGALDLSPDGRYLASTLSYTDGMQCREAKTGKELWRVTLSGTPRHIRYSPDGSRIAVTTAQCHLAMFDVKTGRTLAEHTPKDRPYNLCWSPDSSRVAVTTSMPQLTFLSRDGKQLSSLDMPEEVSSAAFVNDEQIAVTRFQGSVQLMNLRTGAVIEDFAAPGFGIGVAACSDYIAHTRDHGHLLLRRARPEAQLPNAQALKKQNQAIFDERMARNELRLKKIRNASSLHTLNWEKNGAEKVWRTGSPAKGWELWLPLPHGQTHMRFISAESPLLLLHDGRDTSLVSIGETVKERLLFGLFPIVGQQGSIEDAAYRNGLAAVSIQSVNNSRLSSQVLVLEVSDP